MESFIKSYEKFVNAITKLCGVIAGTLVLFTGFMIVYEVICRGVFNAPTEWVMEISTYCVVVAGFLGMGVTYAGKKHIHVVVTCLPSYREKAGWSAMAAKPSRRVLM